MKSQGRTFFLATDSSHWWFLLYSHWRQLQRPSLSHCTPLFSGNSLRCFEQCLKKLQNGSSTRSAVTRGPWAEWVRNCLERPFQVCCRALCNLLSLGGGKACSLAAFMDSFFSSGDGDYVWNATGRYCFPSLFHFQPLPQSVTKHEIKFIKNKLLGLIIFLDLTFLLLLGQNVSI